MRFFFYLLKRKLLSGFPYVSFQSIFFITLPWYKQKICKNWTIFIDNFYLSRRVTKSTGLTFSIQCTCANNAIVLIDFLGESMSYIVYIYISVYTSLYFYIHMSYVYIHHIQDHTGIYPSDTIYRYVHHIHDDTDMNPSVSKYIHCICRYIQYRTCVYRSIYRYIQYRTCLHQERVVLADVIANPLWLLNDFFKKSSLTLVFSLKNYCYWKNYTTNTSYW